jgi:MFS transporter, putative metabolite transport protein
MPHTTRVDFDQSEMTHRQRRIAFTAVGGYFVDGYDLLVLSGALLAIIPELDLSPGEIGALTASAFLGMALGSAVAGPLTDRFGRRLVFMVSMVLFVVASLLFLGAHEVWQLIALRLFIGIAIGADMPAAGALIAEFVPAHRRGRYTSMAGVAWMLGSLAAIGVTLAIYSVAGVDAWRWVMATGCLAALVLIVLRHKTPESPSWLRSRGRDTEADAAWKYATGRDDSFAVDNADAGHRYVPSRLLFSRPLVVLLIGITILWFFNNLYGSAILLYQPVLIQSIVTPEQFTTLIFTAATTALAVLIGTIVCFFVIERLGRRFIALAAISIVIAACLVIWAASGTPLVVLLAFGAAIGFINGGSSLAFYAWSPELFPTLLRGRAIGFVNMVGKLGSVIGTFALPFAFAQFGTGAFLIIAGLAAVNLCCVYVLTMETKGKSLDEVQLAAAERYGGTPVLDHPAPATTPAGN